MKKVMLMSIALGALIGSIEAQNVGIGTASPVSKLEVLGDGGTTTNNLLTLSNNTAANFSGLWFRDQSAGEYLGVIGNAGSAGTGWAGGARALQIAVATNTPIVFQQASGTTGPSTASFTSSERMRIDVGGNVGIGTPSPTYPLTVLSSTPAYSIRAQTSGAANNAIGGFNTTASGTGVGNGVVGSTIQQNGVGLFGQNLNTSGTGVIGVGNNSGTVGNLAAGSGGAFTGITTGVFAKNTSTGASRAIYSDNGGNIVSVNYYSGSTQYKINGTGTVSTVVSDLNGNKVTLHCPETPEIYFQDYGEGELVNGKAHIQLDPVFSKNITVNKQHPLRAFIQLNGDCKGVYTINETQSGFDVVELQAGQSNVKFHWTVTANRADEELANGRISKNADMRFEKAAEPLKESKMDLKVR